MIIRQTRCFENAKHRTCTEQQSNFAPSKSHWWYFHTTQIQRSASSQHGRAGGGYFKYNCSLHAVSATFVVRPLWIHFCNKLCFLLKPHRDKRTGVYFVIAIKLLLPRLRAQCSRYESVIEFNVISYFSHSFHCILDDSCIILLGGMGHIRPLSFL